MLNLTSSELFMYCLTENRFMYYWIFPFTKLSQAMQNEERDIFVSLFITLFSLNLPRLSPPLFTALFHNIYMYNNINSGTDFLWIIWSRGSRPYNFLSGDLQVVCGGRFNWNVVGNVRTFTGTIKRLQQ